jgi:hypothetical protein
MNRTRCAACAVAALCALSGVCFAAAQSAGYAVTRNPYTGTVSEAGGAYNPYTGASVGGARAYNPATGARAAVNPYTREPRPQAVLTTTPTPGLPGRQAPTAIP